MSQRKLKSKLKKTKQPAAPAGIQSAKTAAIQFAKSIPLSPNQKSRIVSLVEARAAAQKHMTTLDDSIKFMLATIIECSNGDPAANYSLVDNGSRLEIQ